MPVSLAKIANNTANVAVQASSDPADVANITYYPGRITERVFAAMDSFGHLDENNLTAGFKEFNETLANLIKTWDVFEDEAQMVMFPIDAARFPELPFSFRMGIVDAIMGDIRNRPETIAPQTQS